MTEIVELRAALASLRVVVEAAKAFSAAWLRWSRSNAIGVNVVTIDAAHTLCEALDALHADPSAPTPLVSVTRAQAEQRLTDEFLANLYDFVDMTEFVRALPEMKQDILTVLFVQSAPTPR